MDNFKHHRRHTTWQCQYNIQFPFKTISSCEGVSTRSQTISPCEPGASTRSQTISPCEPGVSTRSQAKCHDKPIPRVTEYRRRLKSENHNRYASHLKKDAERKRMEYKPIATVKKEKDRALQRQKWRGARRLTRKTSRPPEKKLKAMNFLSQNDLRI